MLSNEHLSNHPESIATPVQSPTEGPDLGANLDLGTLATAPQPPIAGGEGTVLEGVLVDASVGPQAFSPETSVADGVVIDIAGEQFSAPADVSENSRERAHRLVKGAGGLAVIGVLGYASLRGGDASANGTGALASMSFFGLWGKKGRHSKLGIDRRFYQESAGENLKKINYNERDPSSPGTYSRPPTALEYNPVFAPDGSNRFVKAHMTKRGPFGEAPPDPSTELAARTGLQNMASVRHNKRTNKHSNNELRVSDLTTLYAQYNLRDPDVLKRQLAASRLSILEKRTIRKTAKEVRALESENASIVRKMVRGSQGEDLPNKLTRLHP